MSYIPELREVIDPPAEITDAAEAGELILFVGSGFSTLAGLPTWSALATAVLEDLRQSNLLNFSDIDQLSVLEPRKQLSIAKRLATDNNISISLQEHLQGPNTEHPIYKAINDIGCTCVTTNYDKLLKPHFTESHTGSTGMAQGARISEVGQISTSFLDTLGNVIHLHGSVEKPETMVVTTKDYLTHYVDENINEFLVHLFKFKTVVFLGYGLEEAEILEHMLRRGSAMAGHQTTRFSLQGFFRSQKPLYERLYRYYEESFGVQILGFLRDHNSYDCQTKIMEEWSRRLDVQEASLSVDAQLIAEIFPDE